MEFRSAFSLRLGIILRFPGLEVSTFGYALFMNKLKFSSFIDGFKAFIIIVPMEKNVFT
jgi:hypothetical protein